MQNDKDTFEYTLDDTGYSVKLEVVKAHGNEHDKRFFIKLHDKTYEKDVQNILCVNIDTDHIEKGAKVYLCKETKDEYQPYYYAEKHTVPFNKEYCLLSHMRDGGIFTEYFVSEREAIKEAYRNIRMDLDFYGAGKIKTKNAKHQIALVQEDGEHPIECFVFKMPTDILGRIKNSLLFARSAIRVFTETEGDTYFFALHLVEGAANATIDLEKIPLENQNSGDVILLASGVETFEETFATTEEAVKRMQIGAEKFRKKYRNSIWDEDDLIERDDGGFPMYVACSDKAYQVYQIEDAPKTHNDKVRYHMWLTDTILNCATPSMKAKIIAVCNKRLDEVEQEIERLWGTKGEE